MQTRGGQNLSKEWENGSAIGKGVARGIIAGKKIASHPNLTVLKQDQHV